MSGLVQGNFCSRSHLPCIYATIVIFLLLICCACFSSAPQGTGILGYWLLISKLFNTSLNFLTIHGLAKNTCPPTPCSTIMYIFIFIFSLPPNLGKPLVLTKESLFTYFLLQLKNFSENCKLPLSLSISLNGC